MKKGFLIKLIVLTSMVLNVSCASIKPKTSDLNTTKNIQTVELTKDDFYIYAQNDVLLEVSDMDKKLIDMNPEWKSDILAAKRYEGWSGVSSLVGFLSLIGCLVADDSNAALAWCGGSIGASLISIPLGKKGRKKRHKVVTEFNSKL